MRGRRSCGFTLVELLVAITIFAVLSAMAYGGLSSVLSSERAIDRAASRLVELQQTMLFVTRDLAQLAGRGIRDEYGDSQPPLRSAPGLLTVFEFTRGGWSNPAGQMRSTLQRVGYAVEERQLVRYSWSVLERAPDSQPMRLTLLTQVEALQLRFMDEKREWHEAWPPVGVAAATAPLPRAVELTLELEDIGTLRRLFAIDATVLLPTPPAGGTGAAPAGENSR